MLYVGMDTPRHIPFCFASSAVALALNQACIFFTSCAAVAQVETFLDWWVEGDNGVIYTPNGLAWTSGGAPLRNAANAAFIALAYGDRLQSGSKYYQGRKYACWGILQLRYILGGKDGETAGGQSFMVSRPCRYLACRLCKAYGLEPGPCFWSGHVLTSGIC